MGLRTFSYAAASGELREVYDQLLARPMPATYRPAHGGVSGIAQAHSLDPQLLQRVFAASPTLLATGPLDRSERELVAALTSRLDQCFYCTACHLEFLRDSLGGSRELALAVAAAPHSVRTSSPRLRSLAEIATLVAESPWALSPFQRERAAGVGLGDEAILQAVLIGAFLGHHNRIIDAVGIGLDYDVEIKPPVADPAVPPFALAPAPIAARAAIDLARRPSTAQSLAAWRSYMFDRDAPLSRRQRTVIARWVALWLGDATISPPDDLTINPMDDALRELAETVTLAPWRLSDASFARLRAAGFDDAALFDACATASTTGMLSRITVALAALGRERT